MNIPVKPRCQIPCTVDAVAGSKGTLLVEHEPWNPSERGTYDPTRLEPPVWTVLAKLADDPTPERCAAFGSEWGLLLRGVELWHPPLEGGRSAKLRAAQLHRNWYAELMRFAVASDLFWGITSGRWTPRRLAVKQLKNSRGTPTGGYVVRAWREAQGGVAPGPSFTVHLKRKPRNRVEAARALLDDLAQKRLRDDARLARVDGEWCLALESLAACAWLQMLDDAEIREAAECARPSCTEWFVFDPRNPKPRRTCSDKCRVAEHRRKQRE